MSAVLHSNGARQVYACALVVLLSISSAHAAEAPAGKTYSLAVNQGLRFSDGAVVVEKRQPVDIEFQVVEPTAGGLRPQFNGFQRKMEWRPQMPIDGKTPVLSGERLRNFVGAPDLEKLTTGDFTTFESVLYLSSQSRYWLVQDRAGDGYLVKGKSTGTESPDPKQWKFEFSYQKVLLPLGPAGKKNPPLPDRLVYRSTGLNPKVVVTDLASGEVRVMGDGRSPSVSSKGSLATAKGEGDWTIQDAAGRAVASLSPEPVLYDAVLSPDGKQLAGTSKVQRFAKVVDFVVPAPDGTVVRVVDLGGKEIARFDNATDAVWTSDGRLLAAPLEGAGLLRCDPATGKAEPLGNITVEAGHPALSPDGKALAYVAGGKAYLTDLAGGKPRLLWDDKVQQRWPTFSPDGRYIAFISQDTVHIFDRETEALITPVTRAGWGVATDNGCRLSWVK